jgi:hypothetical protein
MNLEIHFSLRKIIYQNGWMIRRSGLANDTFPIRFQDSGMAIPDKPDNLKLNVSSTALVNCCWSLLGRG